MREPSDTTIRRILLGIDPEALREVLPRSAAMILSDRRKLARELLHVIGTVLHLALYYDLRAELEESVEEYYQRVIDEGLVEPLAGEAARGEQIP